MKVLHLFVLAAVIVSCLALAACGTTTSETATTIGPTGGPGPTTTSTAPTTTAPESVELSFSYHAPPQASLAEIIFDPWAKAIEEASGGRITIVQHAGGTLFPAADVLDGVMMGVCDIGQVATEEYPGRFQVCEIGDLPFVWPSVEAAGPAYNEFLLKYQEEANLGDVKLLLCAPMWGQQLYSNREVETLEDLAGMKIRASGKQSANIIMALGATPIEVETGDLFSALDTGMVEGTFFTWSGYFAFGLKDVTTYKVEVALTQPVHLVVMNKQKYESLPDDLKAIIDEFSGPEVSAKYAKLHADDAVATKGAVMGLDEKTHKPPIYVLPTAERDRWADALKSVLSDWIDDTPNGQALYDDLMAMIKKYQ